MQDNFIYIRYNINNIILRIATFLMILFAIAPNSKAQQKRKCLDNSKENIDVPFGMRLRKLPEKMTGVYEPVIVQKAPTNGATCVRLTGDTLKIFYINKPGDADKIMSVTSNDGGLTWNLPRKEFDLPGKANYANQMIMDNRGRLQCIFPLWDRGEGGYRGRLLNLWYCHTDQDRKNWTTPREIFHGYVGALRGFIQLKSGRLLLAFARAVPEREKAPPKGETDYGWNDIISLYSDDGGKIWKPSENNLRVISQSDKTTRYGGIEPTIVELKNGKTWMLIRTNSGYLYESYSNDGGKSWEEPKVTKFVSSNSPAELLRLSDNRIIIFWCSDQCWDDPRSYADGGREVLHAAISNDGGKTWKGFREVLTKPVSNLPRRGDFGTSYSSAVETTHGKVVLVSGQGAGRSIVLFDLDWLEDEGAADDFSDGLVQWTMYGGDSVTRLAHLPKMKNKKALWIRKSAKKKNLHTEAEWNFPMMPKGEMILKIRKNMGSKGISLALTDHFSTCGDTLANKHAVFTFLLDGKEDVWREANEDMKIKIKWDIKKEKAKLYLNGQQISVSVIKRQPYFGVNYLRIGIPGNEGDMAGYYVKSVEVRKI